MLLLFSPIKEADSIEKPGHRLLWYKVDWHLLLTFWRVFSPGHRNYVFFFSHTNTVSQDYPCTPGSISQLGTFCSVSVRMDASEFDFFLCWWCVLFLWVISPSLMVIMLLDFSNKCVSVCTPECAHERQMRSRLPSQVPELPSNITHGLCFDPLASHSPQPPLKPSAYWTECVCVCMCVCDGGYRDACTVPP